MSWYTIGKIKDAHGLKGEVYLLVFSGEISWASEVNQLNLLTEDQPDQAKTFKIKKSKPHKKGLILTLEGVNDRNQSEAIKGMLVQIPEELLKSNSGEAIYLKEVLNFKVMNHKACIGVVKEFSSNGAQDLLVVEGDDRESLVPFIEEFIESIDFEACVVYMKLPEGLLEL